MNAKNKSVLMMTSLLIATGINMHRMTRGAKVYYNDPTDVKLSLAYFIFGIAGAILFYNLAPIVHKSKLFQALSLSILASSIPLLIAGGYLTFKIFDFNEKEKDVTKEGSKEDN